MDKYADPKWTWRYQAKCRNEDTEIFFPPRDKDKYKPIADKAKSICFGKDGRPPCPVRLQCLTDAIEIDEEHGIFGGMSHRERNAMKRKYEKANMTLEEWLKNGGKAYEETKEQSALKVSGNKKT